MKINNGKYWDTQLTTHKFLEVGYQPSDEHFDFNLRLAGAGYDHAGLSFFIQAFGWMFELSIYDHRHWDYDKNQWGG